MDQILMEYIATQFFQSHESAVGIPDWVLVWKILIVSLLNICTLVHRSVFYVLQVGLVTSTSPTAQVSFSLSLLSTIHDSCELVSHLIPSDC